jgi:hypothetical protein
MIRFTLACASQDATFVATPLLVCVHRERTWATFVYGLPCSLCGTLIITGFEFYTAFGPTCATWHHIDIILERPEVPLLCHALALAWRSFTFRVKMILSSTVPEVRYATVVRAKDDSWIIAFAIAT